MTPPTLTSVHLKSQVKYNPTSGNFEWLVKPSSRVGIGDQAGYVTRYGYRSIRIGGRAYLAHRLAWLFMIGEWPAADVDHINGDRLDNRWSNLRPATRSQNIANKGTPASNTSGIKGVSWRDINSRWRATLKVEQRQIHLGYFDTKEEAGDAYRRAAAEAFGQYVKNET